MNVLVARSVAMPRRQTALKSAASALAMMAVGGVLTPSVAADWYYVGNPQNGVGFFQDSNSWVMCCVFLMDARSSCAARLPGHVAGQQRLM